MLCIMYNFCRPLRLRIKCVYYDYFSAVWDKPFYKYIQIMYNLDCIMMFYLYYTQ